jgi:hypothetical protein
MRQMACRTNSDLKHVLRARDSVVGKGLKYGARQGVTVFFCRSRVSESVPPKSEIEEG